MLPAITSHYEAAGLRIGLNVMDRNLAGVLFWRDAAGLRFGDERRLLYVGNLQC